jgi:predicted ArsR family transcriptional regulator
MPTKHPRIFLTLSEEDDANLTRLAAELGLSRPAVLRKLLKDAVKERAK